MDDNEQLYREMNRNDKWYMGNRGGGDDQEGCAIVFSIVLVLLVCVFLGVKSCCDRAVSWLNSLPHTPATTDSLCDRSPDTMFATPLPADTPAVSATEAEPEQVRQQSSTYQRGRVVVPASNPQTPYEIGYDQGYDDGEEDGASGDECYSNYAPGHRYRGNEAKQYRNGYRDGYLEGFSDGRLDYEDEYAYTGEESEDDFDF